MANSSSLIALILAIYREVVSLFVQLLCQIIRWPNSVISNHRIANEKVTGHTAQRARHGRNAFWAARVYRPRKGGYVKRICLLQFSLIPAVSISVIRPDPIIKMGSFPFQKSIKCVMITTATSLTGSTLQKRRVYYDSRSNYKTPAAAP